MRIGLLGVPANSAGRTDGVARAPRVLREAGLVAALRSHADVTDHGDVTVPPPSPSRDPSTGVIDPAGLNTMLVNVERSVRSILTAGEFPLVIGGDCPLLVGCLAAVRGAGLLFVDGHEDAYLPRSSSTGEAADMELAMALGLTDLTLDIPLPVITPSSVQILGPRDAEELSKEGVPSLSDQVPVTNATELSKNPAAVTRAAVTRLATPYWYHLDLDVLSTEALSAVDYQQPGGLTWPALNSVTTQALTPRALGHDITIYNPDLDPTHQEATRIITHLTHSAHHISLL